MKEYINSLMIYLVIMSAFFSAWEKINQVSLLNLLLDQLYF